MCGKNVISLDPGNIPRVAGQSDSARNMPPVLPARPPTALPMNTSLSTEWQWVFLCIQILWFLVFWFFFFKWGHILNKRIVGLSLVLHIAFSFLNFIYSFIFGCTRPLLPRGLCSSCGSKGRSLVAACRLLIAVASLVGEHGLQ